MEETEKQVSSVENYNFVQLNRSYMKQMRELARRNPVAMQILFYLV